ARRVETPTWIHHIADVIGIDTVEVRRLVREANARGQAAVLRRNAPFAVRAAVEETRENLPGLEVVVEPLRHYPNGTLAAHLLGYAGEINDEELDSLTVGGYRP